MNFFATHFLTGGGSSFDMIDVLFCQLQIPFQDFIPEDFASEMISKQTRWKLKPGERIAENSTPSYSGFSI